MDQPSFHGPHVIFLLKKQKVSTLSKGYGQSVDMATQPEKKGLQFIYTHVMRRWKTVHFAIMMAISLYFLSKVESMFKQNLASKNPCPKGYKEKAEDWRLKV